MVKWGKYNSPMDPMGYTIIAYIYIVKKINKQGPVQESWRLHVDMALQSYQIQALMLFCTSGLRYLKCVKPQKEEH